MGTVQRLLGLGTAAFLAACADNGTGTTLPEPLTITSVTPVSGAADVETGASVTVVFNQAIDPTTLTAATFLVKQGGASLPAALGYDGATRTAWAAAPLLPDSTYEVEVTTGVRAQGGAALAAPQVWSFTTRVWQAVTIDAGLYPSLAVDQSGRINVSYMDLSNDLHYASCLSGCDAAAAWQAVVVEPFGGPFTSLAVDATGQIHVSYLESTLQDLNYATCAAHCNTATSWLSGVQVDAAGYVGQYTTLDVDASRRVHIGYYDVTNFDLKYATCATGCDAPAGWQLVTVDALGNVGRFPSLAVDASGRVHISYYQVSNYDLKYATCAANCDATAGWDTVTVDGDGVVGQYSSLVVDANGRIHISYRDDTNGALKYATCTAGCDAATGWKTVAVDTAGNVGEHTSLAEGARGRLHVTYYDQANADLKYATCAAGCEATAGWRAVTVDTAGEVGRWGSLAVDANGRLHVAYHDFTNGSLKYLE